MTQTLVFGSSGQLAHAFKELLPDAVFLDRLKADLSKPDALGDVLARYAPDRVINAAAYTQVDKAETEEALAHIVNAQSPGVMARYCAEKSIPFAHFSTDYVFDGKGKMPWREDDKPSPLNAYGRSKQAGEEQIIDAGGRYLIFRASWIYDATGKNFFNTLLRLAGERDELNIIDDQYGAPTYALDLAKNVLSILQSAGEKLKFPAGIYHLCNGGVTTWHGFASAIVEAARARKMSLKVQRVNPISASQYPLPASRPSNSRLDCALALSMFGVKLPHWQDGLARCMELKA